MSIRKLIKDNKGESYVGFIVILFIMLIVFGSIIASISIALDMRDIKTSSKNASKEILSDIKVACYDKLISGSTYQTEVNKSSSEIAAMLAQKLGAEQTLDGLSPVIVKKGVSGKAHYRISSLSYMYIEAKTNRSAAKTFGDVNRDGKVDDEDIEVALEFLNDEEPLGITADDVDVNNDGEANEDDIVALRAIVQYYKNIAESDEYKTSTSVIMITFKIAVNLNFGEFQFGNKETTITYVEPLSFKTSEIK